MTVIARRFNDFIRPSYLVYYHPAVETLQLYRQNRCIHNSSPKRTALISLHLGAMDTHMASYNEGHQLPSK